MPYSNISAQLSNADKSAIAGHLNAIKTILSFGVNLTNSERQSLQKMGDKRLAFVTKVMEYSSLNPSLIPGYLSLAEASKDFNLDADLRVIEELDSEVLELISDTRMAVGAEVYDYARAFYASVQEAAKRNVPGVDAILADLKTLFEGQGEEPVPPITPVP